MTDSSKPMKAHSSKAVGMASDEEMRAILNYIISMTGIERTDENSVAAIKDWLYRNRSNWGIEEIRLAFDKLVEGELGEIEHYNRLSAEYVGKVLNAYRNKYRARVLTNYQQLPEETQVTDQEKRQAIEGFMERVAVPVFDAYRDNRIEKSHAWDTIYENLREVWDFSLEEKERIMDEAESQWKREQMNPDQGRPIGPEKLDSILKKSKEQGRKGGVHASLKIRAKKIACRWFFDRMLQKGEDIRDYMK